MGYIAAHITMENLYFVKLTKIAFAPEIKSAAAAGYDLKSPIDCVIEKENKKLILTDISIQIPKNSYGRIASRSGLSLKHFISVGGGVIDSDYRGNIGVILFNHSKEDYTVKRGERIAQLIIEKLQPVQLIEVEQLESTSRNESGFGSTGRF